MNRKLKTAGFIYSEERYSARCAKGRTIGYNTKPLTRSDLEATTKRKRHLLLHMIRIHTWAILHCSGLHVTVVLSLFFYPDDSTNATRKANSCHLSARTCCTRKAERRKTDQWRRILPMFHFDIDMLYLLAQRIPFIFFYFWFVLGTILSATALWFLIDNAAFCLWCLLWYMGSSSSLSSYSS